MDLLDASADFDPSDFDPLASPFRTAPRPVYQSPVVVQQQQQQTTAPDSPFTAAFGGSSIAPPPKSVQQDEETSDLLINLSAPTPRPAPRPPMLAPKPLLLAQPRLTPPVFAPVRNPSPLKQVYDFDAPSDEEEEGSPSFARESPPGTVRKVAAAREEEGTSVKSGRRWSVMQREEEGMRTARKVGAERSRSRSVSPSKDTSPARFDADASGFFVPIPSDSDCSLLMDEGGSFLLNGSHDAETTLNSFGPGGAGFGNLSGIGEEDEEEDDLDNRDMANLLNGLSDSCIGGRPPTAIPSDSISSILPPSLTSSTRHALSKSQRGRLDAAAEVDSLSASTSSSVTIMDNEENDERSLLACSTASYRTHRDSPARPRMVSIQAERVVDAEKTPMKGRLSFGSEVGNESGESRRSSGGCSEAESSSGDVKDMLKGWSANGDLSMTDLYAQQPPSPLNDTSVVATATFELGLVSPILPDKISALPLPDSPGLAAPIAPTAVPLPREQSPTDLIELSEVIEAPMSVEVAQPAVAPAMVRSASANGLKRLQEKLDAIRARTAAPSAPSTSAPSSIDSSPIATRSAPLSSSISATPRRQQQPPARSLLDATPLASSSSTTSFTRPASTVRRPTHSRQNSIPILEDAEEMDVDTVFNPHRNAQPTTSPRAEALIDFMDTNATPAPKLARSGGMSMPMAKVAPPAAMATPMARAPTRPRTSLLPSARKAVATPSSSSSKENGAPAPISTAAVPASARKEATREKLDRLKEERKRREETGRSPVKSLAGAAGLKRPTVAPPASRLPPPSSAAAVGALAGLPRPRPPLGSRTAPTASSATRPSLADTLSRKPTSTTTTRVAFKPTVPRPAASSSSSSSAFGGKPKPSLATAGFSSTGLRRPAMSSTGLPVAGGSRIGKPTAAGGAGAGGSRIAAPTTLGARANGAK